MKFYEALAHLQFLWSVFLDIPYFVFVVEVVLLLSVKSSFFFDNATHCPQRSFDRNSLQYSVQ